MRREEKEIKSQEELDFIIKKAAVCRIAFSKNDQPYIVPVNFGYKKNTLYFHSAREGKKIEILKLNNKVCFQMDTDVQVVASNAPCDWTTKYYSVIGYGKAFEVDDPEEKISALNIIMGHYAKGPYEYPERILDKVLIFKIEVTRLTGKKSGY